MAQTSRAWVMDVGAGQPAAAGAPHVVEYLLATETVPIPRVSRHCRGLLSWRGRLIPVIDLAPLVVEGTTAATATRRAVVLAWQERPGEPLHYGALLVTAAPAEASVSDDMAGNLADAPAVFHYLARAGFMDKGRLIPILDVRRLFGRGLPAELPVPGVARNNVYSLSDAASASNETAPSRTASDDVTAWETFSKAMDLLSLPSTAGAPSGAAPAARSRAVSSTVVIPFSADKAELRRNILQGAERAVSETMRPSTTEASVPDEALLLDEPMLLAMEPDIVAVGSSVHIESSVVVPAPDNAPPAVHPHTGTIESFERLRAIKQKATPFARNTTFRQRISVITLVLGLLCIAYFGIAYSLSSRTAVPGFPLRDVTPGGIDPHSVPAVPAQPPK